MRVHNGILEAFAQELDTSADQQEYPLNQAATVGKGRREWFQPTILKGGNAMGPIKVTRIFVCALALLVLLSLACGITTSPTSVAPTSSSKTRSTPVTTSAQQTQTPPVAAKLPATPQPLFAIVPFNYSLKETGDGWNQGEVWLAFENKTNGVIWTDKPLQFPNGVVVETVEGPTYPAQIDAIGLGSRTSIDASRFGVIPPGFRLASYQGDFSTLQERYEITWKSAMAAAPKVVRFNDYPGLSFTLPAPGSGIKFPFDDPPSKIQSFADLKGMIWSRNEKGLEVTFTGRCGNANYFDSSLQAEIVNVLYVEVQVENHDAFNQQELDFSFPVSAFYHESPNVGYNGLVWVGSQNFTFQPGAYKPLAQKISIGPGQNRLGYVRISRDFGLETVAPPIVVLWRPTINANMNDYQIYDGKECSVSRGATPTPTSTSESNLLSLQSRQSGLDKLKSYRMKWQANWKSTEGGSTQAITWNWVEEFSSSPQSSHQTWQVTDSEEPNKNLNIEVWQISNTTYLLQTDASGKAQCFTFSSDDKNDQLPKGLFSPNALGSISNAKFIGAETIHGIKTRHYRYDEKGFSLFALGKVSGDIWVAVDDGFAVTEVVYWRGMAGLFGSNSNARGDGKWVWELTDINQPILINEEHLTTNCTAKK